MAERRFDHERSDVPGRVPAMVVLVTLVAVAASIALVAGLVTRIWAPAPPGPEVFAPEPRPAQAPVLQQHPRADLERLQRRWQRRLDSYGWVDREAGIVHIPIDAAMDRVAEQGLPGAAQSGGGEARR